MATTVLTKQESVKVPTKINLTVYGYIHDAQNILSKDIPDEIILLCLAFYYIKVQWNEELIGQNMQLKADDIVQIASIDSLTPMQMKGSAYCDPITENEGIYRWKFKIIHSCRTIMIGICKTGEDRSKIKVHDVFGYVTSLSPPWEQSTSWNYMQFDQIPDNINLTVSGYIRKIQDLLPNDIPIEITFLCLSFYYIKTEWNKKMIGKQILLKADHIIQIDKDIVASMNYNSAYCNPVTENKGIYRWKFKILHLARKDSMTWYMMIGVHKCHTIVALDDHFGRNDNSAYVFVVNAGKIDKPHRPFCGNQDYGKACIENDVVEIILNLDELTLRFDINGVNYGKAFDVERTKYRAAVCMYCRGDAVKLLSK